MHVPVVTMVEPSASSGGGRRNVYVPSHRAKPSQVAPTLALPRALALSSVGAAFRDCAWAGPVSEAESVLVVAEPIDVRTPVRAVFSSVAWTGERPQRPSPAQLARSVHTVLSSFHWE